MRCDQVLRSRIEANLRGFESVRAAPGSASGGRARSAAVAITVVDSSFGPGVPGLPQHDEWADWNAGEMRAAVEYLERQYGRH